MKLSPAFVAATETLNKDDLYYVSYWYPFERGIKTDLKEQISKRGLLPADMIKDPERMADYASRANGDAEKYFRDTYDRFYKPVLKRPYKHYGVYSTPLDLLWTELFVWRVRIDCEKIEEDAVIQVGADVKKLTRDTYYETMKKFPESKVREIWKSTTGLRFKRLPQIVYFGEVPLRGSIETEK